jgi:hypothetical protein
LKCFKIYVLSFKSEFLPKNYNTPNITLYIYMRNCKISAPLVLVGTWLT